MYILNEEFEASYETFGIREYSAVWKGKTRHGAVARVFTGNISRAARIFETLYSAPFAPKGIPEPETLIGDEPGLALLCPFGKTLNAIKLHCGNKLSVDTILDIAWQGIELLRHVHETGFVLRNVTPWSFVYHNNRLYLVDVLLAKDMRGHAYKPRHRSTDLFKHPFSSQEVRDGCEPTYGDDITSFVSVLTYLASGAADKRYLITNFRVHMCLLELMDLAKSAPLVGGLPLYENFVLSEDRLSIPGVLFFVIFALYLFFFTSLFS
jgi:hypothetical protein